jgi:hypothetical protein
MSATRPFFIPQKEINLIDSMNEELIDEILGQSVDIYKVSVENTDANMYGESTAKYYNVGFRVNCMLLHNQPDTLQDEFGAETNVSIEMYFQRNNLASGSLEFFPEVGDIVDWNDQFWEMNSVTEPKLIGGHPNFRHNIVSRAHRSRLSNLQIEERSR